MSRLLGHLKSSADALPPSEDELREARLRAARACPAFTEVKDDFVARGRRLVSASTDRVYKPARGRVFATASAELIASHQPLSYTVAEDGALRFYELEPRTWSEQVGVLARRRFKRRVRR